MKTFGTRVVSFIQRRAVWLILAVIVGSVAIGAMALRIKVDNSLRVWFVDGDPALVAYDNYKKRFGNDETIIIAATDPVSVYSPAALGRIRSLSKRLADHPSIRRVTSITRGLHVSGAEGVLEIEQLLDDGGAITVEKAAEVKRRVEANPIFKGVVTGKSDQITLILVDPKTYDDFDAVRPGILKSVKKIVDEELRRDGGGAHMGGIGVVYEGLNEASLRDSSVFVSLSYLVILLGVWVMFRRLLWVGVALAVITTSTLATVGIAGAAGRDMNMVLAVLPTLLMTIGILDLVHIVDAAQERSQRVGRSLAVVMIPCVFNTVTDAVGFMALYSAKIGAVRDLGWLAAAGLGVLLLCVLVFTIPAITRYGARKPSRVTRLTRDGEAAPAPSNGWTHAVVGRLFVVARDRSRLVVAATVVMLGFAVWGVSRINVDTYTIGFLPTDHEVRRDHRTISDEFGDYIPLEIVVSARKTNTPDTPNTPNVANLKQPSMMLKLDAMERRFEALPAVARATGLPEVVKRVNKIWNDEKPENYTVPKDAGEIADYLFNYRMNADGRDHLDDMVDPTFMHTRVTTRTNMPTARGIEATVAQLHRVGREVMGDDAQVEAAGYLPLYVKIIRHITHTQVTSFAIAMLLVSLVLMLLLRSVKLGIIAMIPNLLPATLTLGFMGFAGIRLDVGTVLIAAIAIGISVNDTSHIMFRFKHEFGLTPDDPEGAVERMMRSTGRAVVASSLILMAGFAVLMFASVKSIFYFGLLSSATIGAALLADLVITPALLLAVSRRR